MKEFKDFYYNRKGKYILFFGFYLIFFIFFGFYLRAARNSKPPEDNKAKESAVEKITTYDISNLINNDYSYSIEINDDDNIINFSGTKDNIDYANYTNKYFLDIYNINQLLKRSTFVDSKNYILEYQLSNKEINDILLTDRIDGMNKIEVIVNEKKEVNQINIDLSNYLNKSIYQITINYIVGEKNENSPS